ncbi:RNA polymerase sigma factor [Xylanibacter muris]|uniref:Sigma-70 family RNA polymerase sigma factor n=1 Tax=Xylanibacter muris TaxID=2736290 RepID=A0ABX2ASI5_9BACT|nr:sigma-70 family RNA polymerase sigma factor [Xylanibacter muris]NPD92906.1 sigma-70 family RNA polymerase sigma factor [Xylanibacter muris]
MELEEFNHKIVPLRKSLLDMARTWTEAHDYAEDAVQEVMLRLWSMRDRLDAHPNIRALAFTTLKNIERDHWRHLQIENISTSGKYQETTVATNPEDGDDMQLIRMIIEKLPPLQSKIFRMKEIEGYTKEEIIKITGCTDESLRQNLSRARKKIRAEFIRLQSR